MKMPPGSESLDSLTICLSVDHPQVIQWLLEHGEVAVSRNGRQDYAVPFTDAARLAADETPIEGGAAFRFTFDLPIAEGDEITAALNFRGATYTLPIPFTITAAMEISGKNPQGPRRPAERFFQRHYNN